MALNHELPVMRLYHQAKELLWDPRSIDLTQDQADWQRLDARQRDLVLRLCTLFVNGEEAVTHDLVPLLLVVGSEGRREEELFLTTQLFEEAKHVEFFDRWLATVAPEATRDQFYGPSYRAMFEDALPQALTRLLTDRAPSTQIEAVATYHMTVEGVLAETGYFVGSEAFAAHGVLPGLVAGLRLIQRDEARHIAYGISVLQRLLDHHPELWPVCEERMDQLLAIALGVIDEGFAPYGDAIPFDLTPTAFVEYASGQWGKRLAAIQRIRPDVVPTLTSASAPTSAAALLAFSPAWVAAIAEAINHDAAYAQAASNWIWPIALVVTGGSHGDQAIWLDLERGRCRDARLVTLAEAEQAPFVLRGEFATWRRILGSEIDPVAALVQRRLRLSGSLSTVLRHVNAARALVGAAARVPAIFPA